MIGSAPVQNVASISGLMLVNPKIDHILVNGQGTFSYNDDKCYEEFVNIGEGEVLN
ncbi:hypothetical protein J23TS9_17070 [Paenibacillus sp. J23TS9]|nr:hypothetical protein J23TS9_17070 [Paenibacillus sp. J23TS9]